MNEGSNKMIERSSGCQDISVDTNSEIQNVIRPYGYSVSKCGYCKGSRSDLFRVDESTTPQSSMSSTPHCTDSSASKSSLASKSYSVLADSVSPKLYEELINLGWRRSGLHLYKPQNFSSCCPTLTTRLLTKEFKPSKSQRKVLKKMERIMGSLEIHNDQKKDDFVGSIKMVIGTTPTSTPTFTSKKQKRNHRKQNQSFSCSDNTMGRIPSTLPLPVEEQILATGILQTLEQATTNAIEKYLASSSTEGSNYNKLSLQNSKEFQWKTSYRMLRQSKRERKQSQVRAVSPICAQICGQLSSSFPADPISREKFVQHVVYEIKNSEHPWLIPKNNVDKNFVPSPYGSTVSITSIEAHQASGQISCTIKVKNGNPIIHKEIPIQKNENDVKMDESSSGEYDNYYQKSNIEKNVDKLTQWYEKATGKQLDLEQSKRRITIETLPSHQSALNPEVHKLYTHYQHVVHGDPDPFSNDPDTSNLNMDSPKDNGDDETKIETDNPSKLDWGDAPTSFTNNVANMLTSYIKPLDSKKCRRAVLSNYYSFYQFLVEAPFPPHGFCNKEKGTPSCNDQDTQQISALRDANISKSSARLPFGLYHQHYRIGGEYLIAVGVIDILPSGLSSVYLFYHPGFSNELVALGKYAILKEIQFARDVLKVPYYYLGY